MLWTILGLIIIGLIAGLIARAIIPGKHPVAPARVMQRLPSYGRNVVTLVVHPGS